MVRALYFLLVLLCVSACGTPQQSGGLPTSERLEQVRFAKAGKISKQLDEQGLALGDPVFIRVFKYENTVEAWVKIPESEQYALFKSYPICNFSGSLGPKIKEGDYQSPEGFYSVGADQLNPWSQYHLSFNLGFPNEYDRAHGRSGQHLMIHGNCKSQGCYAITDAAIEEVYLLTEASIANGFNVPVHAFPFRMTPRNMARARGHRSHDQWEPFWLNLKQGYDAFELTKIPPEVTTRYGQNGPEYVIQEKSLQKLATAF